MSWRSGAARRANVSSDLSGLRAQIDRIDGELAPALLRESSELLRKAHDSRDPARG